MKRKIGIAMSAAPFAVIAAMTVVELGFLRMFAIFGGTAALIAWIGVAVHLMDGDAA